MKHLHTTGNTLADSDKNMTMFPERYDDTCENEVIEQKEREREEKGDM